MTITARAAVQTVKNLTKTNFMRKGVPMVRTAFTRILANGKEEMVTVIKDATTGKATKMIIEDEIGCLERVFKAKKYDGNIFSKKLGKYIPTFETGSITTYSSLIEDGKASSKILWSNDASSVLRQEKDGLRRYTHSLITNAIVRTPERGNHEILGYSKRVSHIWDGIDHAFHESSIGNPGIDLTSGLGKPRSLCIANNAGYKRLEKAYLLPNDKGGLAILEGTETPIELAKKGFDITMGSSYAHKFLK